MKISKLLGERTKIVPNDVSAKGYANLLKGAYIKQVSNGIFTLLPPAKRVVDKIANIIREEMNSIDGQEVLMPVLMTRELWEESGRYSSIEDEMFRLKDRTERDMVLGMTHEEPAVHLVRHNVTSYSQLPLMIYQIQTKLRDEPRARGGLIRVKEFTMKDAYSFHESQECLDEYYDKVYNAYNRIFSRIGMNNFIAVASDSGMMGGSFAHEFMLLSDIGEDTLVVCDKCGYKSNMEVAEGKIDAYTNEVKDLEKVFTGEAKTIEEVCNYLKLDCKATTKAVCYANKKDVKELVIVFIRGDLEVNEAKLKKVLGFEIIPAKLEENSNIVQGNIGPLNLKLDENAKIIFDESLKNEKCLVIGANEDGYHYLNFNPQRDLNSSTYVNIAKVPNGAKCTCCGSEITLKKGVEIGNIFKLGIKYTKSMNMTIQNKEGKLINPIMGCYGIGLGRALACIAEESSDDKGLIWPISIAPWEIYMCPLRYDDEKVSKITNELYDTLSKKYDVILDDRTNVNPGVKFTDSELLGVPFRLVISPKSLEQNTAEISMRANGEKVMVELEKLEEYLNEIIVR